MKNLKTNVSASSVSKVLSKSRFNPKTSGAMKGISQLGEPAYYECRIHELVSEASECREDLEAYSAKLEMVIRLAALSVLWNS